MSVLACWLLMGPARATPNFPPEIQAALDAVEEPPCDVCHKDGMTALGTVTTPFGTAMRDRGLVAIDSDSLIAALDQMEHDGVDSDGDGVTDLDELTAGDDPNAAPPEPTGCGCASGPTVATGARTAPSTAIWTGLFAAVWSWRRWPSRVGRRRAS